MNIHDNNDVYNDNNHLDYQIYDDDDNNDPK